MPAVPLIEVADLEAHMGRSIAQDDLAIALEAIRSASGAVLHAAGRETPWPDGAMPEIARTICLRCAQRMLTNPEQRQSFAGPEGLSFSGSPVRILTQEERDDLAQYGPKVRRGGVIAMAAYRNQ